ncbi:MAG: divergent polysaccharide deacetylase family protein [Candidatus Omnitrophica bacterium]|nr:divergent polysaccharide deacetylase family protein [Candidatus Omnitrophota bacterium]
MKKNNRRYKVVIGIALLVVICGAVLILSRKPKAPMVKPAVKPKVKIAIVIDDWGYNLNNLGYLKEIRYPLTLAVLPNLHYSRKISQEGSLLGFEIILHLPMEPLENLRLEKNTITASMEKAKISMIIKQDLENMVNVRGVSNHMGSKVTRDERVMSIVFKELKKKNLYFLDSFVTPASVCAGLAKDSHLPFAERDIFLDNKEERSYIIRQLNKLKVKAKINGYAIGIGHDRKNTLSVLKEAMSQMEKEGYKFVFVSELAK